MRIHPETNLKKNDNGDYLYNLSIGVIISGCCCLIICISILIILEVFINHAESLNDSSSSS